jgi:hypothetical protein
VFEISHPFKSITSHQTLVVGILVLVVGVPESPEEAGKEERPALNQSQRQVAQTRGVLGQVRLFLQIRVVVLLASLQVESLQIHWAHRPLPQALTVR